MPVQFAAKPGGTALTAGTLNVEFTPVMPGPGAVAYPDQLRLEVVALRVGRTWPLTAEMNRPWFTAARLTCAVAVVVVRATGTTAETRTSIAVRRRTTATFTLDEGHGWDDRGVCGSYPYAGSPVDRGPVRVRRRLTESLLIASKRDVLESQLATACPIHANAPATSSMP